MPAHWASRVLPRASHVRGHLKNKNSHPARDLSTWYSRHLDAAPGGELPNNLGSFEASEVRYESLIPKLGYRFSFTPYRFTSYQGLSLLTSMGNRLGSWWLAASYNPSTVYNGVPQDVYRSQEQVNNT